MRLISATLRNYRIHRELKIEFDLERTLIGGPNECGKSTLVEAIHRGLFMRARVTGSHQQAMKSFHGGHPEVELVFEVGLRRYQLRKRFSGQTGTTSLTSAGGAALSGDSAETELARLFWVSCDATAKVACEHWAHLWVWQGQSGLDPAEHANRQRDTLLQRLGKTGGATAIMQSELDSRVAKIFADASAATFKQGDKSKVDSDLARAEAELAAAQEREQSALSRLEVLRHALRDHTDATTALATVQQDVTKLRSEIEATEAKAQRLAELQRLECIQVTVTQETEAAVFETQRTEEQIAALRAKIDAAQAEIAPREAEIARLVAAVERARTESDVAHRDCDVAHRDVLQLRQQRDLAAAQFVLFGQLRQRDELGARLEQVKKIDVTLADLRAALAKLVAIEPADLKRLEKMDTERTEADATLRAMAAGIELLAGDQSVTMGAVPLAVGQPQIVTEDTELQIGQGVRLRISPGGGSSLAEARRRAQDARAKLTKSLDSLGVPSVAAAAEISAQRREWLSRIQAETTRREDMGAGELAQKWSAAVDAGLAAEAEIARRAAALGLSTVTQPADEASARRDQQAADERLTQAEAADKRVRAQRDIAAKNAADLADTLTRMRASFEQQTHLRSGLQAQEKLLRETHGEDAARAARLIALKQRKTAAASALAETRKAISLEQPEHVKPTQARLKRALDEAQRRQQEAEQKKAVAEHTLRTDGSMDPEADVAIARAAVLAAEGRLVSVRRRAHAIRLLDELFRAEQQTLADQFTRPLVDRASAYLRALYGPEARLDVTFENGQFSQLRLIRPQVAAGAAVPFEQLSGGTKEQVAVAMRLAMAEVLATDHDGSLPLILDDAFVNADPERVSRLQIMLDLAATRGLQIIVLTCTPSDYMSLGARLHSLHPPVPDRALQTTLSPIVPQT